MEQKKVLGIEIKYPAWKNSPDQFHASFFIEKGVPSNNFISSDKIRKVIKGFESKNTVNALGKQLGYITFQLIGTTAGWKDYYPLGLNEKIFRKKGIASLLELIVLKDLKRKFPEIKNLIHLAAFSAISKKRRKQLIKRNLHSTKKYSLDEMIQKTRRELMQNRSKARKKTVKKAKTKKKLRKVKTFFRIR